MAILFVTGVEDPATWVPALRARLPEARVYTEADAFDRREIEIAVVAAPRAGALRDLPGLRLVQSLWMGVDGLVADPTVPRGVPIARMVDPEMTSQMPEAALAHVLHLHRLHDVYARQQREREWRQWPQPLAGRRGVGVLGLGQLGARTAAVLAAAGFRVHGFSRSPKRIDGVETHTVLAASEILVNLLPLTAGTRGLLDAPRLAWLPHGACVVNLGRGEHIVDADLLAALDAGRLRHAVLDVFDQEPLPPDHPYWTHPAVTVMPHVAAQSTPESCLPVVAENVRRLAAGEALLHLVDRDSGY
ncbi:glyoxylate/hydroxypyruvate reductase A [Solirubrobacter ginsenosidimutans]|uniref:Glyoxylate/hydroxypyruvate reductase A n=1 Tax=Solirubrobacter ginsenosidimutans TaxID=490573 RepID=A0A9X3MW69_9ACTN|nr:glyoxylate/hydroxypyruvate reductase A [Solirubrobacter ginsenosidimutans]MDA0162926.1 glyoxylate/hydroxypyruvate reductase A [Solirubrobacter ginsenosidimutans]